MMDQAKEASSDKTTKKIGFENLAKTIGAQWKSMSSEEDRAPYKRKAAVSFD